MLDILMLPIAPSAQVGESAMPKVQELTSVESFGMTLSQAKTNPDMQGSSFHQNATGEPDSLASVSKKTVVLDESILPISEKPPETEVITFELAETHEVSSELQGIDEDIFPQTDTPDGQAGALESGLAGLIAIDPVVTQVIALENEITLNFISRAEVEVNEPNPVGNGNVFRQPIVADDEVGKQDIALEVSQGRHSVKREIQTPLQSEDSRNVTTTPTKLDQAMSTEAAPRDKHSDIKAVLQEMPSRNKGDIRIEEVAEALRIRATNMEVKGGTENNIWPQQRIKTESATVRLPQTAPILIESALPQTSKGEITMPVKEVIVEDKTANTEDNGQQAPTKPIKLSTTVDIKVATNTTNNESNERAETRQNRIDAQRSIPEKAPEIVQQKVQAVTAEQTELPRQPFAQREVAHEGTISNPQKNPIPLLDKQSMDNRIGRSVSLEKPTPLTDLANQAERQATIIKVPPQPVADANDGNDPQSTKQNEGTLLRSFLNTQKDKNVKDFQISEATTSRKITTLNNESQTVASSTSASTTATTQAISHMLPKQLLNPQAPMAQLESSVRWLIDKSVKGAEIQLHPENLGRVTVQLKVDGSDVHARVWASEAATVPLLKNHRAFLESSLKEQGLTLSSFDLQQGKGGQQTQGDLHRHHQHFAPPMRETWTGSGFRQELPTQLVSQPVDDGRVELYA